MSHAIEALQEELRGLKKMQPAEGLQEKVDDVTDAIGLLHGDVIRCPMCSGTNVASGMEKFTSNLFEIGDNLVKYEAIAMFCNTCEEGWCDSRKEAAEISAMLKVLKVRIRDQGMLLQERTSKLKSLLKAFIDACDRYHMPDAQKLYQAELASLENADA